MQIDLFVHSEPLVVDFEINLDILAKNILFNLSILPVKAVGYQEEKNWPEYWFIDDLRDEKIGETMIFKKTDLEELIAYKIEKLNKSNTVFNDSVDAFSGINRKAFKLQPEKWEIEVVKKDLLAGKGQLKVFIQEEMVRDYDFEELKQKIKFKNTDYIKKELESISSIKKIEIKSHPWFWKQAPFFSGRITFRVVPINISSPEILDPVRRPVP